MHESEHSDKNKLKEKGFIWFIVPGDSLSVQRSQVGRKLKQLTHHISNQAMVIDGLMHAPECPDFCLYFAQFRNSATYSGWPLPSTSIIIMKITLTDIPIGQPCPENPC